MPDAPPDAASARLAPSPAGAGPSGSGRVDRGGLALAAGLILLAGFVDAVAFLGFGGVFASFMSGNTTRLGVALGAARAPEAVLFASAVVLFVAGVAAGRMLRLGASPLRRSAVLTLVGLLLAAAAAAARAGASAAALVLATFAMGVQNAAIHKAGAVPVTPTYVTGALVRLGEALADRIAGRGGRDAGAYLVQWCGLALGAAAGAWAFGRWGGEALVVPAVLALVMAAMLAIAAASPAARGGTA